MNAAWIDDAQRLPAWRDADPVGVDTEFIRRDTFYPKLALVQAAHHDQHWLLDPLAYDTAPDVRTLVTGRVCIMHSAGEDLEALSPLLDDAPLALFDTQIAAALCGMGASVGYQKLVATLLGIDIPKDETRSDWLHRPLSAGQLEYAAQDVAHLIPLHDALAAELQRRGRAEWHAEDCSRLVQRSRNGPARPDPQPQQAFPGAADWPREVQARLRRVLRWRDETARALDRPRAWLLDDAHALALSQQPPRGSEDLFERVRGQRALRSQQRSALLAVLQAPVTGEELAELLLIRQAPKAEARHASDAMRQVVHALATRLDLPPGLLCPRRLIDEFVGTRAWPAGLSGWREALLKDGLTRLLPG